MMMIIKTRMRRKYEKIEGEDEIKETSTQGRIFSQEFLFPSTDGTSVHMKPFHTCKSK